MVSWAATRRRFVREPDTISHDDTDARFPPALACHVCRKTPLAIERADEFVHVDDLGLEFANQERMPLRVPCQEVDHAAFTPDRERDLGRDGPRRPSSLERPGDGFVQRRVACTDEALEVPATPARLQVEPNVEGRSDSPERVQRNLAEVAALDARRRPPRDLGCGREIILAPPVPDTRRADHCAESVILHGQIIATSAHLAVMCRDRLRVTRGGRGCWRGPPSPSAKLAIRTPARALGQDQATHRGPRMRVLTHSTLGSSSIAGPIAQKPAESPGRAGPTFCPCAYGRKLAQVAHPSPSPLETWPYARPPCIGPRPAPIPALARFSTRLATLKPNSIRRPGPRNSTESRPGLAQRSAHVRMAGNGTAAGRNGTAAAPEMGHRPRRKWDIGQAGAGPRPPVTRHPQTAHPFDAHAVDNPWTPRPAAVDNTHSGRGQLPAQGGPPRPEAWTNPAHARSRRNHHM